MADEAADAAAAVVSQAIEGFGAHLAAQAFTPPAMVLRAVEDIYFEGLRASRSKASAARVHEAWEEAATKLPAQVAADVRRTLEALPGSTMISKMVANTYVAATGKARTKAQEYRTAPNLPEPASVDIPATSGGGGGTAAVCPATGPRRGGAR